MSELVAPKNLQIPFKGKSMYPFLIEGDCLTVELFGAPLENEAELDSSVEVGQLCLLREGSEWVVHRYLGEYQFKGDWSHSVHGGAVWGIVQTLHFSSGRKVRLKNNMWKSQILVQFGRKKMTKIKMILVFILNLWSRFHLLLQSHLNEPNSSCN